MSTYNILFSLFHAHCIQQGRLTGTRGETFVFFQYVHTSVCVCVCMCVYERYYEVKFQNVIENKRPRVYDTRRCNVSMLYLLLLDCNYYYISRFNDPSYASGQYREKKHMHNTNTNSVK